MSKVCVSAYMINAAIDLVYDFGSEPLIIIDPSLSERHMDIPMDYVTDGFLVLDVSAGATGYVEMNKEEGYLMVSARFNKINHEMEIPVETIIAVKSGRGNRGKIMMKTASELVFFGDDGKKIVSKALKKDQATNKQKPIMRLVEGDSKTPSKIVPIKKQTPSLTLVK